MRLSDYAWKWLAIGQQLATVMNDEDADRYLALADRPDQWRIASQAEWDEAADWLALPPRRLAAKWAKVPVDHRPILMLQIQYLCRRSANAARQAEVFEELRGKDSRQDLADAARWLLPLPTTPSAQDLKDVLHG